jgi:apolipoprotein N-acyltransferase
MLMLSRWFLPAASAVAGGLLLTVSFESLNIWGVAWLCLVPVLWSVIREKSLAGVFALGMVFGLSHRLTSMPWIISVVKDYSSLHDSLAVLALVLLAIYLAMFPAVAFLAVKYFLRKFGLKGLFTLPVIWTALELLQTYLLSGFPWNLLGYSQVHFLPAIQIADITGVYGVSFLIVAVNAAFAFAFNMKPGLNLRYSIPLGITALLVLLTVGYGISHLWSELEEETYIDVALVQDEFDNDSRLAANPMDLYNYYIDSTRDAAGEGADVVLWGEGAMTFIDMYGSRDGAPDRFTEQFILSVPRDEKVWLLMGSNDYFDNYRSLYNIAVTISPDNEGKVTGRYVKNHLTPFGEYVPFKYVFFWIDKMVPEISDFESSTELNTIPLLEGRVGVPICLEVIFPDLVRRFTYNGATILASLSNDAWFGRSAANDQHFNHAIMRAVENRRYFLRCAVSGVSGIITPRGEVTVRTPTYQSMTAHGKAAMREGMSVYAYFGDMFAYLCCVVAIGLCFWVAYMSRKSRQ